MGPAGSRGCCFDPSWSARGNAAPSLCDSRHDCRNGQGLRPALSISLGKFRRLHPCAPATGRFVIVAADHRQNLRSSLQPNGPERIDYALFADFKRALAKALSPAASAILVDPEFGLGEGIRAGA